MIPISARPQAEGALVLEGGAEFGGRMAEPDERALELAGGLNAPVRILPTAAAPDQNHVRAGNNGVEWFHRLGARDVKPVMVIDRQSAADPALADSLRAARLIYLLGGFPRHLGETLRDSPAWDAALEAWREGAVIAGSSAGAMVLCGHYYDPHAKRLMPGLGLVPGACLIPHHNSWGQAWAGMLRQLLPEALLIGIDEGTGIIRAGGGEEWMVLGGGEAALYLPGEGTPRGKKAFRRTERFKLP